MLVGDLSMLIGAVRAEMSFCKKVNKQSQDVTYLMPD